MKWHYTFACLFIVALIWASWFFRYAPQGEGLVLDRWAGKTVFLEFERHESRSRKKRPSNNISFDDLIPDRNR